MTGRIPDPLKAALAGVLVCASMVAGVARAEAPSTDGVYERALLLEADRRCGLFEADVRGGLAVSAAQARAQAERAGAGRDRLDAAAARGRARARATPCASPDLAQVTGRVRTAFSIYADTPRMVFPAGANPWRADRTRQDRATWRLAKTGFVGGSPVTVGYQARGLETPVFAVTVAFRGRPRPYAARIVARDPSRAREPWLPTVQAGLLPSPPSTARRAVWAASQAPADRDLLPAGARSGETWRFDEDAARAISALDARETFTVEFLFRDDSIARTTMTAGDFAAARAFVAMGSL